MNTHDMLAALTGADDQNLFAEAGLARRHAFGNAISIQAVIDISTVCRAHCRYCEQRADNARLQRRRMRAGHVLDTAALAAAQGAGTIVLQSGNDEGWTMELVGELIRSIKERHHVAVALSLGDRGLDEYAYWRGCGADRCLLNLETTDRNVYKRVRQGEDFSARLHRLEKLRNLGFEVGSGVMAGLPGASPMDGLLDIIFLTALGLDMVAAPPFIPRPDTPMAGCAPGSALLADRMTAVLRILNPEADIPALDGIGPEATVTALARGCNALMPVLAPADPEAWRVLHPGREADPPLGDPSLARARQIIEGSGFVPATDLDAFPRRGHV